MQMIAREVNCSETVFVFDSIDREHDVYFRFFNTTTEVKVCGHATIASSFVLSRINDFIFPRQLRVKTDIGVVAVDLIEDSLGVKLTRP